MLLDRSLRATIGNFSTLFLVAFSVLIPLHLLYGLYFHEVLALRELHEAIELFPSSRQVRGVGKTSLDQARTLFWVLVLIELALIPLFLKLFRKVLATDSAGEVPTVIGAWRTHPPALETPSMGNRPLTLAGAMLVGVAIGVLSHSILMTVVDLLPDEWAFAGIALAQTISRSSAAAFVLVGAIYALGAQRSSPTEQVPDLY